MFYRDCRAMTEFRAQVSILDAQDVLPNGAGNVLALRQSTLARGMAARIGTIGGRGWARPGYSARMPGSRASSSATKARWGLVARSWEWQAGERAAAIDFRPCATFMSQLHSLVFSLPQHRTPVRTRTGHRAPSRPAGTPVYQES